MIAFGYTHEDFYGDRDSLWIHGWTGDHGVTGRFSYLYASIMDNNLRPPMATVPSPMRNNMQSEISTFLDLFISMMNHIDLLMLDRGFYSKDLIMSMNERKLNYLIFAPTNTQVKDEFSSIFQLHCSNPGNTTAADSCIFVTRS